MHLSQWTKHLNSQLTTLNKNACASYLFIWFYSSMLWRMTHWLCAKWIASVGSTLRRTSTSLSSPSMLAFTNARLSFWRSRSFSLPYLGVRPSRNLNGVAPAIPRTFTTQKFWLKCFWKCVPLNLSTVKLRRTFRRTDAVAKWCGCMYAPPQKKNHPPTPQKKFVPPHIPVFLFCFGFQRETFGFDFGRRPAPWHAKMRTTYFHAEGSWFITHRPFTTPSNQKIWQNDRWRIPLPYDRNELQSLPSICRSFLFGGRGCMTLSTKVVRL